jgi:GIY-YIG catalytic domain
MRNCASGNLEIPGLRFAHPGMTLGKVRAAIMSYYVYIIASRKDGAIYIGVTNDIVRRIYEHRIKAVPGVCVQIQYHTLGLVRNLRRSGFCDFPRERT